MGDVIDLQKEKDRLALEAILKEAKEFKGFDIELNLFQQPVMFTGHVIGGLDDARLTVIVYTRPETGPSVPIGAMRFSAENWHEMISMGSRLLEGHLELCKK